MSPSMRVEKSRGAKARVGTAMLAGLAPWSGMACAVCYGDPGAPASRGLAWAVVALVGVVALVLTGVVAFFVHAVRQEQRKAGAVTGRGNVEVQR